MVKMVQDFYFQMVIDELYGNFVIWLCEFLLDDDDDDVWNVDWKRRGRLADVSCYYVGHLLDRCYHLNSTLYWNHMDPMNFAQTLIDHVIVEPVLLD